MSNVSTTVSYSSYIFRQNITSLLQTYPFLNVQTVGNSVLGTPIYALRLGRGSKKVFYSASIHANEWITSPILMKFVEDYCNAYVNGLDLYGYSVRNLFSSVSIYLMPMVNPDGVDLVTGFLSPHSSGYQKALTISSRFFFDSFSFWLESQCEWCGFKLTISCWLEKCQRNQICPRF